MNCIEFRRIANETPQQISAQGQAHLAQCDRCQAELTELRAQDRLLKAAMTIAPAKELHTRIMMRALSEHRKTRQVWAMAASVLLAVSIGIGTWWTTRAPAMGDLLVKHIMHEVSLLAPSEARVTPKQINDVLALVSTTYDQDISQIRHAGVCLMNGHLSAHLVVEGATGPITVMLMPQEQQAEMETFVHNGFNGYVIPAAGGQGAVAIVGRTQNQTQATRQLAARFADQVGIQI